MGGEIEQHAARDRRVHPQGLQRGDQRVAPERGAEPGDAGIGVRPLRGVRDQHVEIRDRAARGFVEDLVGGRDGRGTRGRAAQRATRLQHGGEIDLAQPLARQLLVAADLREQHAASARRQRQRETRLPRIQPIRRRLEPQRSGAPPVVEPGIGKLDGVGRNVGAVGGAPARAMRAAYLEQIGEIGAEADLQREALVAVGEVAHGETLVARAIPQEFRAANVDQVVLEIDAVLVQRGIGEVAGEQGVVVARAGAEQDWPRPGEHHLEARQVSRVPVVQPLDEALARHDIAVAVEHAERIAVLEGARPSLLKRDLRGDDVVVGMCVGGFGYLDQVHGCGVLQNRGSGRRPDQAEVGGVRPDETLNTEIGALAG